LKGKELQTQKNVIPKQEVGHFLLCDWPLVPYASILFLAKKGPETKEEKQDE
jgi:hypothetical protein